MQKAPFTLPANVIQFIVGIVPYVVLIGIIVTIPAIIAIFGISALLATMVPLAGVGLILSMILTIVAFIFNIKSVKPLFAKQKIGRTYAFYASLLSFLSSLLHGYTILGTLVGALIGWYILFQVKSYYTQKTGV